MNKRQTNSCRERQTETQEVVIPLPSGIELVRIPEGKFLMGSSNDEYNDEKSLRPIHVSDFYLARNPVTNEEYGRFLKAVPTAAKPRFWDDRNFNQPKQPVVGVSWIDAEKYCKWAGLRLPSGEEWEYACRAGTMTRFWSGDAHTDLARVGWFNRNSGESLHKVGEKAPNRFGLYDIHGNVWEWISDTWGGNPGGTGNRIDGRGKKADEHTVGSRVCRGGSWGNDAGTCRSAACDRHPADKCLSNLGFRPAKSIS
jgi:formylglycine-generating enzyme required for sulfatase activity